MGRKIPGRKHRGVRDPEQQRAQRLLSKKVDAPPTEIEEQPVPKSVLKIAQLMKNSKNPSAPFKKKVKPKAQKKQKKLVVIQTKVSEGEKPIPKFQQMKGESDNAFLYRVNRICEEVKREAAFEKKFGVDVQRNPETGKVEGIAKRKKDPLELMVKSAKKELKDKKSKKKKKRDEEEAPKLSKSQKRQLKLKEKKKKKLLNNNDDFTKFSDNVKFGEVVHQPPTLSAPKFVVKENAAPRPGQKHLLLKSLIKGQEENHVTNKPIKVKSTLKGVSHKVIDKKGKRKDLPHALRRQLEKQQKEIIEAYKMIKKKKIKS